MANGSDPECRAMAVRSSSVSRTIRSSSSRLRTRLRSCQRQSHHSATVDSGKKRARNSSDLRETVNFGVTGDDFLMDRE